MQRYARWLAVAAVAWASASVAIAQPPSDAQWRVTVIPYVWGKSLEGKVQVAGLSSPVHVPLSEAFETLESAFMGETSIDGPRWGAYIDYQGTDNLEEHEALGTPVEANIRLRTVVGAIYYVAHKEELGGRTAVGTPRMFRIRPLVGARWSKARVDLSGPGGAEDGKQAEWTDVIVGIRADADISSRWTLSAGFDIGGFDPGRRFSLNANAYLGYRTTLLSRPTLLRAGYALLFQEHEQDDFTGNRFVLNMTGRGPVVGAAITF